MSPILTPNNPFSSSVSSSLDERYTSPKPISNELVLSEPRPRTRTKPGWTLGQGGIRVV